MLIKTLYREKLGTTKQTRFTVPVLGETDIGKVIEKPQTPREKRAPGPRAERACGGSALGPAE